METTNEHAGPSGDAGRCRTALVTGGAGGIGRACADLLARSGWTVVVGDLHHPSSTPADRLPVHLDVQDDKSVDDAVTAAVRHGGPLDLLVNCAAIQVPALLSEMRDEHWFRVVDVNLHGMWRCLRAAGRVMTAARSGAVVNIASIAAERGVEGRSAYAASKAAVVSLTKSAAVEGAADGVRVNAVASRFRRHRADPRRDPTRDGGRRRAAGSGSHAPSRPGGGDCRRSRLPRIGRRLLHHGPDPVRRRRLLGRLQGGARRPAILRLTSRRKI